MRSNTSHVLTDCPHREKLGWLECAYLLAPSFPVSLRLPRLVRQDPPRSCATLRSPAGGCSPWRPSYPAGRFPGAFNWTVEWGAAAVLLPWHHYQWYGDVQILRDNFDMMRRFTDYVGTEAKDGLRPAVWATGTTTVMASRPGRRGSRRRSFRPRPPGPFVL